MTLLICQGIIHLLNNMRRYSKVQWLRLLFQTGSYRSSCPKRLLVDHSLTMSSLVISAPTMSFSKPPKLVGI